MTIQEAREITKFVIFGTAVVWALWDIFVERTFGHTATESHWFWTTALAHHRFPVVFGLFEAFLWWHFFWGYWNGPLGQPHKL
jgi:hypothetical protein